MKFNDNMLHHFTIRDQENPESTLSDISEIVERYYDLGKVVEISQIKIGETNFSYGITLVKEGCQTKYFAQLFNPNKSLQDVKYELALRDYFIQHSKSGLKCALHHPTRNEGYAVVCECPPNEHLRYFCMFDFMDGKMLGDREVWAFGKMTDPMLKGMASGIARFHTSACGFLPPSECMDEIMEYSDVLMKYRGVFTEEFSKRGNDPALKEYFDFFADYQMRLLELLDRHTKSYMAAKDELPRCICHRDPSANNYLFDGDLQPITVCDLDFSKEHLRLFDLCWLFLEGFYNPEDSANCMDISKCVSLLKYYDHAMEKAGNPKPGKLTRREREMFPHIFQLVSIEFGFSNVWDMILTNNPGCSNEYNLYWANWARDCMEFVEEHMDEFKERLLKELV